MFKIKFLPEWPLTDPSIRVTDPKFKILCRSTQKVTINYQSVKIFNTVCDRQSYGHVRIPYW